MQFLGDDFLLTTETAKSLYHEVAAGLPIIDYHCHLIPEEVATNRRFTDLTDIWLGGDHYKWRLMRANGIAEDCITGDAPAVEKFKAFARTIPYAVRNPMYHWCHLELRRYFGIDLILNEANAPAIWEEANRQLGTEAMRPKGILERFQVQAVCTTDDPTDGLEHHQAIAQSDLRTRVYPTFRPDKAMAIDQGAVWNPWVDRLAERAGMEVRTLEDFMEALDRRHAFFHQLGGRLSDHGLEVLPASSADAAEAAAIFIKARAKGRISAEEKSRFGGFLMEYFGELDAKRGWTKQLHLGAFRGLNSQLFAKIGPDVGGDAIGDLAQGRALARYLDALVKREALPKVIVYNLNPNDFELFATIIGCFQDGSVAGKLQLGSGWWFNDQLTEMRRQLNAIGNQGLLGRFVGMLTDSRSFLSYPRHEYFRRLVCQILGEEVERGEIPADRDLLDPLVRGVCHDNAANLLGLELPEMGKPG